ncbi:GAF and ANTAR domain-containing protein [Nocardiopsis suaedae]|uniref:GAF and ANTAR domain-containing protein n=1 Tax=Nocardiopsis suaedae TaxID=3018444 RepID=A0ABT4TR16_9ACTN|nr:GAF and ANTAR domain-containing protein [Nocardiopsis suaedae]MDA2806826.1 GAF and ANTAR domain-containing protein [Nocardiopsis suaedae]
MVTSAAGTTTGSYYASTDFSRRLDEMQTALGQGPSISAAAQGEAILVPDLDEPWARRTWPVFVESALAGDLRGVFAFPVGTGAAVLGTLTIHRPAPSPLKEVELAYGLASAGVALDLMLHPSPTGTDATWINGTDLGAHQVEVHQAAGMVSLQLGVTVDEAYSRLRAHAFRHDMTLADVAVEVVRRWLRFTPDPQPD